MLQSAMKSFNDYCSQQSTRIGYTYGEFQASCSHRWRERRRQLELSRDSLSLFHPSRLLAHSSRLSSPHTLQQTIRLTQSLVFFLLLLLLLMIQQLFYTVQNSSNFFFFISNAFWHLSCNILPLILDFM